eukprot:1188512-Prorocentrum_minimum.AAC.1
MSLFTATTSCSEPGMSPLRYGDSDLPFYLVDRQFVDHDEYATTITHGLVVSHRQAYHMFPSLKILYPLEWEKSFDAIPYLRFSENHPIVPFLACSAYLLLVYYGTSERHIRERKARPLKRTLMLWNLFLAIFSLTGVVRVLPHLVGNLLERGFKYTVRATQPPTPGHTIIIVLKIQYCVWVVCGCYNTKGVRQVVWHTPHWRGGAGGVRHGPVGAVDDAFLLLQVLRACRHALHRAAQAQAHIPALVSECSEHNEFSHVQECCEHIHQECRSAVSIYSE